MSYYSSRLAVLVLRPMLVGTLLLSPGLCLAFAPAAPTPKPITTPKPKPTVIPTPKPTHTSVPVPVPTAVPTPDPVPTGGPGQARTHHLSEVARSLAGLSESNYLATQKKWVGTTEAACNYFVTTALCEDGLCKGGVPELMAADFDTYLLGKGWRSTSLADLKALFAVQADFDVIGQRDPIQSAHGHVLVPVGVSSSGKVIVAEGELDGTSHMIAEESDSYMLTYEGGMHFFVAQ